MKKIFASFLILTLVAISFQACNKDDDGPTKVLLFSPSKDASLGKEVQQEIFNNPLDYPILDSVRYALAYSYIRGLKDSILNTGEIDYRDEFAWQVYIIEDDATLNAFATPGGYLYFYTGLIKYLQNEDDLMGVMGHEIAHADKRHSVQQLQREYGVNLLLSIALGNEPGQAALILTSLGTLKFSRNNETEADLESVSYLAKTPYRCDGAATFFKKLAASGQSGGPVFLSTHPSPDDRVEKITAEAMSIGCDTNYYAPSSYQAFVNSLP
ncbi:MAG: putative Zn-dependent protease [Vicingaceae bacterium]|jgi:predicted Zn-dependent protease